MMIGQRIKKIRLDKGMTQKELAQKLSTSQQNLAQYENGKRNPKFETIKKIAAALEIDVYDLLITGDMTPREAMQILRAVEAKQYIENSECKTESEKKIAHKIDQIESMVKYKPVLDNMLNEIHRKDAIIKKVNLLNTAGQDIALKQIELLTKIPEYRKEEDGTE